MDVYVSKTVYPTAESYGTLAGVLRMLADDVEIMAREKEMGADNERNPPVSPTFAETLDTLLRLITETS